MSEKKVATQLVEALRDIGVKHVFGIPSGGWIDYMEAMREVGGVDFVLTAHEGGAGFMADVSGQLTGVPGVCFGTLGPGATNLSTGVGCALLDRSPMIAFTDEAPRPFRGRTTQMGIDHQALFRPLTKKTLRLEPDRVRQTIFEAAALALQERPGPVHIGLPVGLSARLAEDGPAAPIEPPAPVIPDGASLSRLGELFGASRRPLLAIGLGAVRAGVGERIENLAKRARIPVVLTPMAKGLVAEDHPAYAGVLFHALSDLVGETHQQADLIIGVGYDPVEFNYETWIPDVPVVNIDTVPADLDEERYTLSCQVIGDIAHVLDYLSGLGNEEKGWDFEALAARRKQLFERLAPASRVFGPCAALDVLRDVLPPEGIMTCDVGAHTHLIGQHWRTPAPGRQVMTNGWSSMGFGIPAAIAAQLCRPDTPVCAVIGDGGLLMSAGELATAARLQLPVVFVLLSDSDLALIRIKQEKRSYPIYGTALGEQVSFQSSSLFGIPVVRATDPDQFRKALGGALASDGPTIIETVIDSREYDQLVLRKDRQEPVPS